MELEVVLDRAIPAIALARLDVLVPCKFTEGMFYMLPMHSIDSKPRYRHALVLNYWELGVSNIYVLRIRQPILLGLTGYCRCWANT